MSELFPSMGKDDNQEIINKPLFHTIEYKMNDIVEKIENIDKFDEKEIKEIIIRQHQMILNYDNFLSSKESRSLALKLFTNKRFLICFLDVIRLLSINEHEKICINKLAYDYYCLPDKNEEISNLLFQLTTEVNGKEVVILSGILGLSDAKILSMLRNSSFEEAKVVPRVNNFIVQIPYELTMKNLADIYCNLFPRVTTLFVQTMLQVKNPEYSIFESKRFDEISIIMLEIVNSMPSVEIKKVLESYAYSLNKLTGNITVRFSIKNAARYDRIIRVLKEVENEYGSTFKVKIP
jgi:hypothetical protein